MKLLWIFVPLIWLMSLCAYADTCATGPVSGIVGTVCTIGDKTFDFSQDTSGNRIGVTADQLIFTPVTVNGGVGFTLVTAQGVLSLSSAGLVNFELHYVVSITNPLSGALIVGTTTTALSPVAISGSGFAASLAEVQLFNSSPLCSAFTQSGIVGSTDQSGSQLASLQPACFLTSFLGEAILDLETTGVGSSASLQGGTFIVNQTSPSSVVPEPSSLLLLGSGGLALIGVARKKIRV